MLKRTLKLLFALTAMSATLILCAVTSNAALIGDIDGTKGVSASDARLVLRAAVGLETVTEDLIKIADTDENEKLTAADARTILRMSVNLDPVQHYYEKDYSKKPTCTEGGRVKAVCTECDDVYESDVDPLGHNYPDPEILVAVTCDTDGLEKYTCDREGCGHTEEKTVAAGHTPDIPAATCTEDQFCTRGNHVMVNKLGHTTDWGICATCKSFNTEKYSAEAEIVKTKFNEAKTAFDAAYAINNYNNMLQGVAWKAKSYTKQAMPYYQQAKTAYEAALAACGNIPEFASIKELLAKDIENINGVLAQAEIIINVKYFDDSNFNQYLMPLEELNDFNSDSINNTNNKISKLIIW